MADSVLSESGWVEGRFYEQNFQMKNEREIAEVRSKQYLNQLVFPLLLFKSDFFLNLHVNRADLLPSHLVWSSISPCIQLHP